MAVRRLPSGSFQARLEGRDGRVLSKAFPTRLEAAEQVLKWKKQKKEGVKIELSASSITLDQFFFEWFKATAQGQDLSGWKKTQLQQYKTYVQPFLGNKRLANISPIMIQRAINGVASQGRSSQMQRHVYVLLRKLFGDAIENRLLTFNPVIRKLRPSIPLKEAKHLNLNETRQLLEYVRSKRYGLAIWLQLGLGLRVGELQALRWEDVDLTTGRAVIRRNYIRKLNLFRDYPKGRKQQPKQMPSELIEMLRAEKLKAAGPLVVTSPEGSVLPYGRYVQLLKQYCRDLGLPVIGSHGLRHSTSELYMSYGATRDDLRQLFSHSDVRTTDRYVHSRGTNLERVSNRIRFFTEPTTKTDHVSDFSEDLERKLLN